MYMTHYHSIYAGVSFSALLASVSFRDSEDKRLDPRRQITGPDRTILYWVGQSELPLSAPPTISQNG